ncbi:MAG: NAD(P)H-hydrate dehydratase [Kiritimatiellae bacterium]|nr:NAD(P)H-hydrate dehydratase [Kiritimatiellia bacterium]MDD5520008.1 NAD(P)H-hydrate dehydratase [Kiritimatiellia bacterium]
MKVVTSAQMRELDNRMIKEFGVPGEVLMERAGTGVADIVHCLARVSGYAKPFVHLFAGRGNNGGDAFVAARCLKEQDVDVDVWLAGAAEELGGDALKHLNKMKSAGISLKELPTIEDWENIPASYRGTDIVVDGILGTGITGPARGPAARAIQYINALSERSLVVSIDVPSGLNSDTGKAEGGAVRADVTVTMGLPKTGLLEPCAIDFVGTLEVVDLGIPDELIACIGTNKELITPEDLRKVMKRRPRDSHKGVFGHLLIIGGAAGYSGAVALAAKAAVRSGVGLVTVLVPESIAPIVAGIVPEAMVHGVVETKEGSLSSICLRKWGKNIKDFSTVLVGPGMTIHEQTRFLVDMILKESSQPLVLDADALNVYTKQAKLFCNTSCPVIITPHPGELAKLMGCSVADVQSDRFGMALCAASVTGATVVLKGAGTIIAQKGLPLNVNMTGNPGMATGGMGDVLAGLISGLVAQGLIPFDAARVAVYLHGRAGDNVAWQSSQSGITAVDIIEELPGVFRELTAR